MNWNTLFENILFNKMRKFVSSKRKNKTNLFFSVSEYDLCPCLVLPESFKSAISTMLDVSLLKDPVFMLIGISNVFGMAGLYVPFVYLVDAANLNVSAQNSEIFFKPRIVF